jgi:outer membrane immunogenic protein
LKKVFLAAVAATAFVAPQAFAQAKNFEGLSLAFNINATGNKIDSSATAGGFTSNGDATTHSNILSSQLQYNLAAGDKFVFGVGASMGHGMLLVATFNPTGEQVKLQDTMSLYVAPGFAVSDTTWVYGKVAAISAKTTFAGGDNLSGLGYGVGVQFFGNANVFYQVELVQNNYKDNTHRYLGADFTDKYTTNALLVGIGYKF